MTITWNDVRKFEDIEFHKAEGIAKITINRPEVHNAFRPQTLFDITAALYDAKEDPEIGVVVLTGKGPKAFCSGGDQRIRGKRGYVGGDGVPRLNVLEVQRLIRTLPKPVPLRQQRRDELARVCGRTPRTIPCPAQGTVHSGRTGDI